MINRTLWAGLSVQNFFNGYNWAGEPPKLEVMPEKKDNFNQINWFKLDLSNFLARNNWRGETPTIDSSPDVVCVDSVLSLTLSVNTFLQSVRWQGNGKVATIKATQHSATSSSRTIDMSVDDEWKVDDLSDLL